MAETRQVVNWALEHSCPMRQGENWTDPNSTFEQLRDLLRYDVAVAKEGILDGICVYLEFEGKQYQPPTLFGFIINETLAKYGGIQIIESNCHSCEANIPFTDNQEKQLAGCYGSLEFFSNNDAIQIAAKKAGVLSQLQTLFLHTNPLWFGLWVNSPLTVDQCNILSEFLPRLTVSVDYKKCLNRFLTALKSANSNNLNLHVSLAPPGHADIGWRTIWWHCPRCKAGLVPSKAEQSNDDQYVICQVCSFEFDPKPTHSSQSEGIEDVFGKSLDQQLDVTQYDVFVQKYLHHQGYSQAEIDLMFANPQISD